MTPIPATVDRVQDVAPVRIEFNRGLPVESARANALFNRLADAAVAGESVVSFVAGGLTMHPDSVAALNCYLRTAAVCARTRLPFDRVDPSFAHPAASWANFLRYLGARFIP